MDKILLLTDIPTYHKIPLFNQLATLLKNEDCQLKVLFSLPTERRRKWTIPLNEFTFDYSILNEPYINLTYEWTLTFPFFLIPRLFREQPRLIIIGGYSLSTIAITLFSLFTGVPYIIWSGEFSLVAMSRSRLRRILRRTMVHFASAMIAYGTKAAEYIRKIDKKKGIFIAYNTTYSDELTKSVKYLKDIDLGSLQKYRLSDKKINILCVGGLVKRKGIYFLLKALSQPTLSNKHFILHIIGEGPEKKYLENFIDNSQLSNNVIFWGHKDKHELMKYYSFADIFIFPTLSDIWGLVLNEALSAGLPVIASKHAGATYDLVLDGINGFQVDPYDTQEMANKIQMLIENLDLREEMAKNAQKIMQEKFTVEKSALGFVEAAKFSLRHINEKYK